MRDMELWWAQQYVAATADAPQTNTRNHVGAPKRTRAMAWFPHPSQLRASCHSLSLSPLHEALCLGCCTTWPYPDRLLPRRKSPPTPALSEVVHKFFHRYRPPPSYRLCVPGDASNSLSRKRLSNDRWGSLPSRNEAGSIAKLRPTLGRTPRRRDPPQIGNKCSRMKVELGWATAFLHSQLLQRRAVFLYLFCTLKTKWKRALRSQQTAIRFIDANMPAERQQHTTQKISATCL